MKHSFLKMVVLAFIALGFVACGDDSASGDDKDKIMRKANKELEKLCDEGVSEICFNFATKYKYNERNEAKALTYYEKGCNGKDKYGEKYIGESCNRIADIYAQKLEGDKAKQYYAKACEVAGSCNNRLEELDESLYMSSANLYVARKSKEEAQRKKQEQLEQEKSQKELTQTCESDDDACKCENGDGKACNSLGRYSDDKQAMTYYQKGCENGDGESCNSLGDMYERKLDGKQAKAYYQKGCEYDDYGACDNLVRIEKDKEKLVAIFKKMCDNGNGGGCSYLGRYYEDHKQKIATYVKACELGYNMFNILAGFTAPEYKNELLKYLPNLCRTKGGNACNLLWKIGNDSN